LTTVQTMLAFVLFATSRSPLPPGESGESGALVPDDTLSCDAACVDVDPPADWKFNTCKQQLENTSGCVFRRLGQMADGYCLATCGLCIKCLSASSFAEEAKKDDATLRRLGPSDKGLEGVRLLHIPKTGMTSLCIELYGKAEEHGCYGGWYYQGVGLHCAESCFKMAREMPGAPLSTMPALLSTLFREPRAHVLSMYVECAFDLVWPVPLRDAEQGVPGASKREFEEASFVSWLRHYERWGTTRGGDYQCYNPWNLQSRAMSCDAVPAPHHIDDAKMDAAAEQGQEAITALLEPTVPSSAMGRDVMQHVGVVELYDESWCLIKWQMEGVLHANCTCEQMGQHRPASDSNLSRSSSGDSARRTARSPAGLTRLWHDGEVDDRHGLPDHPPAWELGDEAKTIIDSLTRQDRKLYADAVVRLVGDLCEVQRQDSSGQQIVCPGQLQALKARTMHIAGLADRIDAAATPCVGDTD